MTWLSNSPGLQGQYLKLPYDEIPGAVSKRALSEHYKLYTGYVDTVQRIKKKLPTIMVPTKMEIDGQYRSLKNAETFALGGVVLHELYFSNITFEKVSLGKNLLNSINKKWGSINNWASDFSAAAASSRGWAVLACEENDPDNLYNTVLDSHDVGSLLGFSPLLVVDTWEHAYWMDHGTDRSSYLSKLSNYLNWDIVNIRYERVLNRNPVK